MNIIYARMKNYEWVSTPSDAVARELEKLGHQVTQLESADYIPPGDYDFVWSPYESVTLIGEIIAKKLEIPHFSHIETIPPWRFFKNCDYPNYGLKSDDPEILQFDQNQSYYRMVADAWKRAEVRTISNHSRVALMKDITGENEMGLRYPSVDVATAQQALRMYSPRRDNNRIITIARAVPIKRYDILTEVMNNIKTSVKWIIIGSGPMQEVIKTQMTNPKVKLEFLNDLWGWAKWYEIMKVKVMLYAMGGMPPMEAALLDVFPICMEQQSTKHIPDFDKFMEYNFGNSIPIFKHDQIKEAAAMVDTAMATPNKDLFAQYDTVNKFLNGKTNVTPSSVNAKQIIERMEVYLTLPKQFCEVLGGA